MWRILPILVLLSGCAQTAWIETEPHGARVQMDGESLGQTPIEYKEMVWIWTNHELRFDKEGYRGVTRQLTANAFTPKYMFLCLCTAGLLFPVALAAEYDEPHIVVVLEPESGASTPNAIRPEDLERGIDFTP